MSIVPVAILSSEEQAALEHDEQVIERGLGTFVEVGNALLDIRDKRLYRAEYHTFEEYCRTRWSMSRIHAHRLMEASEVVNNLLPIGNILPGNEAQARELTKLNDIDQVLAWKTIVETAPDGKVTAGHVAAVVETLRDIRVSGVLDVGQEIELSASDALQAKLTDEAYERMQRQREYIKEAQKQKAHVANNSGEFEWYTPAYLVEAARLTMGSIDCDPATSLVANIKVKAATFYTLDNSGLDFNNKWQGNVWMNPPYALALIEEFAAKLVDQLGSGFTQQACVLVNNATETEWFQSIMGKASAICFLKGRVRFENASGEPEGHPLQGQAVLYFGERAQEFRQAYSNYGIVVYVQR